MEKREAPQMVYKGKTPQGYRVGIGINGAYGICPFCGKSYTKEELEKSLAEKDPNKRYINFEHVYPRFAVKSAIGEKKKFGSLEHTFLVAVHKECNTKGKVLEDTLKKLTACINKDGGQLNREQAEQVLQYCKKTSIFLRYLTDYENIPNGLSSEQELDNIERAMVAIFISNYVPDTLVYNDYKDFMFKGSGVGFWYKEDPMGNHLKSLEYFYDGICGMNSFLIVELCNGKMRYCRCDEDGDTHGNRVFDKPILWKLSELPILHKNFRYPLGSLPNFNGYDKIAEYTRPPLLRSRLSLGGEYREDKDSEIVFIQDGDIYVYQNGVKRPLTTLKEPINCDLRLLDLTELPDMSKCIVINDFDCSENKLTSLKGCPVNINGDFVCTENNLISLKGSPKSVRGNFYCDNNELVSLEGGPQKVGGSFNCSSNNLETLKGAPQIVGGDFNCEANNLKTLKGAPLIVGGNFYCQLIETLENGPQKIGGSFNFDIDYLKSLSGLPVANKYIIRIHSGFLDYNKKFDNADELRAWFEEYKKERNDKKVAKGMRVGAKKVSALSKASDVQNAIKPDNQKKK